MLAAAACATRSPALSPVQDTRNTRRSRGCGSILCVDRRRAAHIAFLLAAGALVTGIYPTGCADDADAPRSTTTAVAPQPGAPGERAITFPDEPVIGALAVRLWGSPLDAPWHDLGQARGVVTVPTGQEVMLVCFDGIGDQDLAALDGLHADDVQAIYINHSAVTDAGLATLIRLSGLRIIGLRGTNITDAGLAHLAMLPDLRRLVLSDTRITDAGLTSIAAMPAVENLDLSRTRITDDGLATLDGVRTLRTLRLPAQITDAGLTHLAGLGPLEHLDLSGTGLTDAGLAQLAGLTALHRLNLSGTDITGAGMVHLRNMLLLEDLLLRDTAVDDAGLMQLVDLPKLYRVFVSGTRITAEGGQAFREARPDCRLAR